MTSLLLLLDTAKLRIIFPRCFNFTNDFFVCVFDICSEYHKGGGKQRLLGGNVRYYVAKNLINNNTHIFIIGLRTVKAKV